VTSSKPEASCLRNTTLFPINLPARRINTVPGVMLALFQIKQTLKKKISKITGIAYPSLVCMRKWNQRKIYNTTIYTSICKISMHIFTKIIIVTPYTTPSLLYYLTIKEQPLKLPKTKLKTNLSLVGFCFLGFERVGLISSAG
jgi:hypothetical protein